MAVTAWDVRFCLIKECYHMECIILMRAQKYTRIFFGRKEIYVQDGIIVHMCLGNIRLTYHQFITRKINFK